VLLSFSDGSNIVEIVKASFEDVTTSIILSVGRVPLQLQQLKKLTHIVTSYIKLKLISFL
jgi:hypothetical protein